MTSTRCLSFLVLLLLPCAPLQAQEELLGYTIEESDPALRSLPVVDFSDRAASAMRFQTKDLSAESKAAIARSDVSYLKSQMELPDLLRRWEAACALGQVKERHMQAKALQEYVSLNAAKTFTDLGNDQFLRSKGGDRAPGR